MLIIIFILPLLDIYSFLLFNAPISDLSTNLETTNTE